MRFSDDFEDGRPLEELSAPGDADLEARLVLLLPLPLPLGVSCFGFGLLDDAAPVDDGDGLGLIFSTTTVFSMRIVGGATLLNLGFWPKSGMA